MSRQGGDRRIQQIAADRVIERDQRDVVTDAEVLATQLTQSAEGEPPSQGYQNRWSAYFLDDWKITRRLTINAGLRWDFFQVPLDKADARNLRLDILSTAADGRKWPTLVPKPGTPNYSIYDSYNRYFLPRIGLAYRVTDKWVVRSGFGWFVHPGHIGSPTPR